MSNLRSEKIIEPGRFGDPAVGLGASSDVMGFATSELLEDGSAVEEPPSGVRPRDGEMFDETAFRVFAGEQVGPAQVRRVARALRLPYDTAADLTQEALISLWRHRERVAAPRWGAWLYKAILRGAYHHSRDRRRARMHEPAIAFELMELRSGGTPENDTYLRECEQELVRLIEGLRPERREVVWLYLIEEISIKEIAAQLGIPEDTAKTRWRLGQADMGAAFARERAKERFAALAAALSAFLLGLWARFFAKGGRRAGPFLACAAVVAAVALSHQSEIPETTGNIDVEMELPRSSLDVVFSVPADAWAEREIDAHPVNAAARDIPRELLAQAAAAIVEGRLVVARTCLAQYRAAYPVDPSAKYARQYAALASELASH